MNGGFRVASISVALQLLYRVCFVREHCNEAEINAGRGEKEKKTGDDARNDLFRTINLLDEHIIALQLIKTELTSSNVCVYEEWSRNS